MENKFDSIEMAQFYVYGLQRSGTNFIEQGIETTYPKLGRSGAATKFHPNPLWKHSIEPAVDLPKDKPIIIAFKSIYNWIDSIVNRQVMDYLKTQTHYPILPNDYTLKSYSKSVRKPQLFEFSIDQLCKTYTHFYQSWLPIISTHQAVLIQYEDLLTSKRQDILQQISKHFNWDKPIELQDHKPARYTDQFDNNKKLHYLQGQWNPHLDQLRYNHIIEDLVPADLLQDLQSHKLGKPIPSPVWDDYIDHGQVHPYYLEEIVYRIKIGLDLSPLQAALYPQNAAWIEARLKS